MQQHTPSREGDRGQRADNVSVRAIASLDGLELIAASYAHHRFRPHYHETYLVGVTEAGAELFEARGGRHTSPPLSLRFFNPGEVHTGGPPPDGTWTYRCLYPPVALLEEIARELGAAASGTPWFPEMVVLDWTLANALLRTCTSLERHRGGDELGSAVCLVGVLGAILVHHARNVPAPRPVRRDPRTIGRAQDYIAARAHERFGLGELAAAVGLSRFHLVRAFSAQVGLTPYAYQAQVRVERAKAMLRQGLPVGRVATACGFYDRSHLARTFRGLVGIAPGPYQRSVAPSACRGGVETA